MNTIFAGCKYFDSFWNKIISLLLLRQFNIREHVIKLKSLMQGYKMRVFHVIWDKCLLVPYIFYYNQRYCSSKQKMKSVIVFWLFKKEIMNIIKINRSIQVSNLMKELLHLEPVYLSIVSELTICFKVLSSSLSYYFYSLQNQTLAIVFK